ncbi:MAG: STAS/SEC14 domain-containing protein [Thermodesulfobacteriota bacterium]
MIEILDFESEKVLGIIMKGKIDSDDIEQVSEIVESKLEKFDKLSIYVEVESFGGISVEAFFKDLKLGIRNFGKFDKKAVVTDKTWMKKLGEVSDKLFSSIEIKCFSFDEKEDAVRWVSE